MDSAAEPTFANERLQARYVALIDAARELASELEQPQLDGDVLAAEQGLELVHRVVGAAQIDNLARIEAGRLHRIDGHRSVQAHARHVLKLASGEAHRRVQAARALRDLPEVAAAFRSGLIGLDHVQVLARVQANPRIKGKVPARQEKFLRSACEESFDDFKAKVHEWERTVDLNGGFKENNRNHDNRNVRLVHNDIEKIWDISGHFASDQGARMREIFEHYVEMLRKADWAEARGRLGDAATITDLKRTEAQRRADALARIFDDAAGAPADTSAPAIVHNIVWSAEAYLGLAELLGADAAALDTHWSASLTDTKVQREQWCDPARYRCSTLDGVPLEPVEQFMSSLANEIRRVVVNAKGVVIDLGRKARLFTGSARLAAQLQSPHCVWGNPSGCWLRSTDQPM